MPRTLSVFGLRHVGSVPAGCLAREGNEVIGVDVNPAKVDTLRTGGSPVLKEGIDKLLRRASRVPASTIGDCGDRESSRNKFYTLSEEI